MQEIDPTLDTATPPYDPSSPRRRSHLARFGPYYFGIFLILLLVLVPPLISVNRFQRRIALSISQSLGRPVHLGSVSLNILPFPGFTLQNLVVSEDPAFGNEPIIRANSVRATLRISSLWRRQVEFSKISFSDTTSVNLVHLPDGRWNLESILIQASHINAAPTAQKTPGPAPRFPYIEATGARVNLKLGPEKLPISLTDADFALWLPDRQAWHLRLEAHPARTDTDVNDTGTLRVEGVLGHATSLIGVPLDLDAEWSKAPLGEVTHLLLGHDAGIRGNMDVTAHLHGTVGNSTIDSSLRFNALRRAEFIPNQPLNIDIQCHGVATNSFHTYSNASCHFPTDNSTLFLEAAFPDVRDLDSTTARLTISNLPSVSLLDWLHILSPRFPQDLTTIGTLAGTIQAHRGLINRLPQWPSLTDITIQLTDLSLQSVLAHLPATQFGDIILQTTAPIPATPRKSLTPNPASLYLAPTTIDLGGDDPATLEGRMDASGYTLHLSGLVLLPRLIALAKALPPLGDGLTSALPTGRNNTGPTHVDLIATRAWGSAQQWQSSSSHPVLPAHHKPAGSTVDQAPPL